MRADLRGYIDSAKARVKVSDVVGRDVPLDGRKPIRCPLGGHQDEHPSFTVNDEKGLWRCWGCGRGGDHIDWLTRMRRLDFKAAVNELGAMAGLEPFAWGGVSSQELGEASDNHETEEFRRATLDLVAQVDVKRAAAEHYASALLAHRDEPFAFTVDGTRVETTVLGYQTEIRGHSEEYLKRDKVGWADGKLLEHLHAALDAQFGPKLVTLAALASGVVHRSQEDGSTYDHFRLGMYTYPVVDADGRVITITGKHPDDAIADYQLSKVESFPVSNADKRVPIEFSVWERMCYFLNLSALDADDLVATEGEHDVGSVKDRGGHDAVIGTRGSPSHEQLAELGRRRRDKRTYLAFDADESGVEYTWLAAEAMAGPDYDLRVIVMPEGAKDIDDALCAIDRAAGPEALRKLMAEARPVLEYLCDTLKDDLPAAEKDRRVTRFAGLVLSQPALVRDQWPRRLRDMLGASAGAIRSIFRTAEMQRQEHAKATPPHGERQTVPADAARHPSATAKDRVDALRRREGGDGGLKRFEVNRGAAEIVIGDLKSRGRFHHDGPQTCYFDAGDKRLVAIERDNLALELLLHRYGLAPSEELYRYVLDALRLESFERGTRIRIRRFSHYDAERHALYLYDLGRQVYRISPEAVERVDNGTDGKAFLHNPAWEPFSVGEPRPETSAFDELVVAPTPFREGALTLGEQRILFTLWFHSLFFRELLPTRPILALVGQSGSVKTFALKKVGRLLFGNSFNVMQLSSDPKDFDAAVTNSPFVAVDNSDSPVDWLDDRLAVAATGGSIQRRELFTTNRLVEYPITASVAVTSRTPYFRREDIADRLLLFYLTRLPAFAPEADLLRGLERRRDEIMTEVVGHLQEIVGALRAQEGESYPTKLRMADFASFALKIAHAQGWGDRMQSMLARMAGDQVSFALEGEPIRDLLEQWLGQPANVGRWITVADLSRELCAVADEKGLDAKAARSPRALAQRLRGSTSSLQEVFQIAERAGRGRRRYLAFTPKPGDCPAPVAEEAVPCWL